MITHIQYIIAHRVTIYSDIIKYAFSFVVYSELPLSRQRKCAFLNHLFRTLEKIRSQT